MPCLLLPHLACQPGLRASFFFLPPRQANLGGYRAFVAALDWPSAGLAEDCTSCTSSHEAKSVRGGDLDTLQIGPRPTEFTRDALTMARVGIAFLRSQAAHALPR